MNQPTEDRFKQIEERQVEFEKRLINMERYISPIEIHAARNRLWTRIQENRRDPEEYQYYQDPGGGRER